MGSLTYNAENCHNLLQTSFQYDMNSKDKQNQPKQKLNVSISNNEIMKPWRKHREAPKRKYISIFGIYYEKHKRN